MSNNKSWINRILKVFIVCGILAFLIISILMPASSTDASSRSLYSKDQILYWKCDSGEDYNTIVLLTDNVPMNFSYTKITAELPLEANTSTASAQIMDYNPGSDVTYYASRENALQGIDPSAIWTSSSKSTMPLGKGVWGTTSCPSPNLSSHNCSSLHYHDVTWYSGTYTDYVYSPGGAISGPQYSSVPLTYTLEYDGNDILVPVEALTYYTDVQGQEVAVTSNNNLKLQYSNSGSGTAYNSLKWDLARNKVIVRLTATYTYTRLVPLLDGEYTEVHYIDSQPVPSTYGTYAAMDAGRDYMSGISNYSHFVSEVTDYISGNRVDVISSAPVYSVEETVTFYKDVECYVINTDSIKATKKDRNIYLKDVLADKVSKIEYRFTKNSANFSVKFTHDTGFTVRGLAKNEDLTWINGTNIASAVSGFKGEAIIWWAITSSEQHYTTPETINQDIDIASFEDFGATLCFMDANNPTKVIKVNIPARPASPKLKFKTSQDGSFTLSGLTAGSTAIRLCDTDGNYLPLPASASAYFSGTFLINGESSVSANGDQSFHIFTGGSTGKEKMIPLAALFDTNTENLNAIKGTYIEVITVAQKKKAESGISSIFVNPQEIFSAANQKSYPAIIIEDGYLTIPDADDNNKYEYYVGSMSSEKKKWSTIKSSSPVKSKAIVDGAVINIRKSAPVTNDSTFFLPSTYVSFTYNGQGAGVPNYYYLTDYKKNVSDTFKFINDSDSSVSVSSMGASAAPLDEDTEKSILNVFTNCTYTIKEGQLNKATAPAVTISVTSGTFNGYIDDLKTSVLTLSDLNKLLTEKYGIDWTDNYNKQGFELIKIDCVSYTGHESDTNISYTDSNAILHIMAAPVTLPDDDPSNVYTFHSDKGIDYTYSHINLLRYMMGE